MSGQDVDGHAERAAPDVAHDSHPGHRDPHDTAHELMHTAQGGDGGHGHHNSPGRDHDMESGHPHRHGGGIRAWLSDFLRPHSHDAADSIDPALEGSSEGIRAVKVSLAALGVTAVLQLIVVAFTGSIALLADTIHNFADASTAIPLWIAFSIGRRAASRRYTYGYRRAEDLAGLFVLVMIAGSAVFAGWASIGRLLDPRPVEYAGWVLVAGLLGAAGNEFVARYRVRVGRRIGSEALVADGVHARTDALTSLTVAIGAVAVLAGYPRADAIAGLLISAMILLMLKDTSLAIYRRMMDAVDPRLVDQVEAVIVEVDGVMGIDWLRMRWVGHRLNVEVEITVDGHLEVLPAHRIADEVHHQLIHRVAGVEEVSVHIHPDHGAEDTHSLTAHHRSLPA